MKRVIKKFQILLNKKQKKKLVSLFFMMVVGAFLEVLGVSLMVPLISAIMQPNIIETTPIIGKFCTLFNIQSHKTFIVICIIVLICVFVIKDLYLIGQYYMQASFVYDNRFLTQQQLLECYLNRPYEYYLDAQSGEIVRVVQKDVETAYDLLLSLLSLATEMIVSIALVITIFIVNPWITIGVASVMLITLMVISKAIKPIQRKGGIINQKNYALTNKWLLQSINGIKEIKVSQKEKYFEKQYQDSGKLYIDAEKKNLVISNVPRLLIEMSCVCSILSIIGVLIVVGQNIESLVPALGAFAMAAVKLLPSANRITTAVGTVAYKEPALDKLLENLHLVETQKKYPDKRNREQKINFSEKIELEGITYRYPNNNKYILKSANMTIQVGKSVGIVGASGAGKTTAIDILLGLLNPDEGCVKIDGIDVKSIYSEWLSCIGYIPQTIFILDDTIGANIAFGIEKDKQSNVKLWNALEEAQLADLVRELPKGLDTQIGEKGIRLSGGQRQRIGIARALYSNPSILLFDEATSALDNETETALMESINALHGKKTMLIIAHRLTTIEKCDYIYEVKDGKIIEK